MPHKKPIIYIKGPGYSYSAFEPYLKSINDHFNSILNTLEISLPNGQKAKIDLIVEAANPNEIRAYAKRISPDGSYLIRLSAGLSYHVWLASRFILANHNFFKWLDRCKIKKKEIRKTGRKEFLANFSFFLADYYILLHEISHVVLGHCDYIHEVMKIDALSEHDDQNLNQDEHNIRIRKAFEAEADRQAGEWLVGFFENSLGKTGRGVDFIFPGKLDAYEFFSHVITAVFVMFQQISKTENPIHPKPNQRQFILLSAIDDYLKKSNSKQKWISKEQCVFNI